MCICVCVFVFVLFSIQSTIYYAIATQLMLLLLPLLLLLLLLFAIFSTVSRYHTQLFIDDVNVWRVLIFPYFTLSDYSFDSGIHYTSIHYIYVREIHRYILAVVVVTFFLLLFYFVFGYSNLEHCLFEETKQHIHTWMKEKRWKRKELAHARRSYTKSMHIIDAVPVFLLLLLLLMPFVVVVVVVSIIVFRLLQFFSLHLW